MNLALLVYILTGLCLGLHVLTVIVARREILAFRLMVLAWVVALLLLIANAILAQAPPFGNMRHVLSFFPLILLPSLMMMKASIPRSYIGYFAFAAVLTLTGALCMPLQEGWRQMPALQSPWFVPHVTSYVVSYGLMLVATLVTIRSFWGNEKELALRVADKAVTLAFPLMSFGLWSGALWADSVWGGYWAWDIKEVWSLITWLLYIMYFHVRRVAPEWRRTLLILAFVSLLVTFLVVNLLPKIESVHSYAQ